MRTILKRQLAVVFLVGICWLVSSTVAEAATMSVSPSTGVYQAGATFSVTIQVRTNGDPVNAAEGTLKFNPNELSVVSVNRNNSIFNLWVAEPAFSNSAGTVTFSGGVPSGYTGSVGNVLSVTFRTKGAGSPRVSFTKGSVLANDGRGTNVLTSMNGGSYTVSAANTAPAPEVIVEYVPAANTPGRPQVTSATHPDPAAWFTLSTAELSWAVPTGVTSVRTLLNQAPSSVPTKVYENPINSITLSDLPEGESYFHVQFRNDDGWGPINHYRLAVDSVAPAALVITTASTSDAANPEHTLLFTVEDTTSGVERYLVKVDATEPYEFVPVDASGTHKLAALPPGYHSVIVEAFDAAGNSVVNTYSFTIASFDKPVFSDVPTAMSANVVPVLSGITRPNATVTIYFNRIGSEPNTYEVTSGPDGVFAFIPDGTLYSGVYELSARATDEYGAQSELSEVYRLAVQEPGYIRIGSQVVDAMSVIVPLILLALLLVFGGWYMFFMYRRFRGTVAVESAEALSILHREFGALQTTVEEQRTLLMASRKTKKLTKAETEMLSVFGQALTQSQQAVEKEIEDVTNLTDDNRH